MSKSLYFYSKSELSNKFEYLEDSSFIFPFGFLFYSFAKFDKVVISNVPLFFNLVLLNYCISKEIPILIVVDSIIEPIHLSHWPKWKKIGFTGAYQLISKNIIHPLSAEKNRIIPREIIKYMKNDNKNYQKEKKIKVGITISNTPAASKDDAKLLLNYFEKIIHYLEKNQIDYTIRDRSDFFKNNQFFNKRLSCSKKIISLEEFFQEITHLITVPGSLVILGGLSKLHVCQIILSNMFCNTPSTFIINPDSNPENWIFDFIQNKTPNHKFQENYYDYLSSQKYKNSISFNNKEIGFNEKENKFVFFKFLVSMISWDLRTFAKLFFKKLKR